MIPGADAAVSSVTKLGENMASGLSKNATYLINKKSSLPHSEKIIIKESPMYPDTVLQNPENIKLVYKYAREQFKLGNVNEGIFAIKSLSEVYPDNLKIKLDLLAIYDQAKLNDEALSLISDIKKNSNITQGLKWSGNEKERARKHTHNQYEGKKPDV